MIARVIVTPKPVVNDPQGITVKQGLASLGFREVIDQVVGAELTYLWHKDADLKGCDCVILPGGFAYGDHLRTGAIARFAPVMEQIGEFADRGGLVWGICNGFQVLCEAGLLPGAL